MDDDDDDEEVLLLFLFFPSTVLSLAKKPNQNQLDWELGLNNFCTPSTD